MALFANIFSRFVGSPIILLMISFALLMLLSFIGSYLLPMFEETDQKKKKILLRPVSKSVLSMFSSSSFTVCSLTFRSLIHFEFIFVDEMRQCSNFIPVHVAIQVSQRHLLKRLSFPPLYITASFDID